MKIYTLRELLYGEKPKNYLTVELVSGSPMVTVYFGYPADNEIIPLDTFTFLSIDAKRKALGLDA